MIFLDSSFLIAFYNDSDDHYKRAIILMNKIVNGEFGDVIVSDYVFDEIVTVLFSRLKDLDKVSKIGENIRQSSFLIWTDESIFEEAWEIFRAQKGTKLSFTDCAIVALMRGNGIKYIATFDEDFKNVEGFEVVGC